jgi:hypothetical protein
MVMVMGDGRARNVVSGRSELVKRPRQASMSTARSESEGAEAAALVNNDVAT